MPAFAFRHIKDLYPVFWDKSQKLVQALMSVAREEGKDVVESIKDAPVVEIGGWGSRAGTSFKMVIPFLHIHSLYASRELSSALCSASCDYYYKVQGPRQKRILCMPRPLKKRYEEHWL